MSKSTFAVAGCGLALLLAAAVGPAHGQAADEAQRFRVIEEPFRLQLDETVPPTKRAVFDWGGWFRSSYWGLNEHTDRDFDGRDDGLRAFRQQQLRLWGHLNLDGVHEAYARMRLDHFHWNSGTSYTGRDRDWDGPNLERGWYYFRLSRARQAYGWDPADIDFGVKVGRQYVEIGSGLALSLPLDAVVGTLYCGDWSVTGMGAMSVSSTYNVDQSAPGGKEDRRFYGVEINYHGIPDHQPFAYFLGQDDQDFGRVANGQTYGFNSRYVGGGARGRFFHRDLQYSCELVGEWGKSHAWAFQETHRQNIEAWALDTELRYIVPDRRQSQFSVQYLLASGDSDRTFSPTNTLGGNAPHTADNSFVSWGYRNTGLVLSPRMSNLGMARLGASSYLLNEYSVFEQLLLGVDFFFFHKQQAGGAISDSLSLMDHHWVGSELDLYADWRLTSDLSLLVRYGVFWPGDAFWDGSYRHLFFTGVTLNF